MMRCAANVGKSPLEVLPFSRYIVQRVAVANRGNSLPCGQFHYLFESPCVNHVAADHRETIAAIASASGGAARGIVRISGEAAIESVRRCFFSASGDTLTDLRAATAIRGLIRCDAMAAPLPCHVYVWPNARSYTREPLVEIHTLGSPPLLQEILQTLTHHGVRLAQPGEFTLRAFLAGRLDLTQAEAVLGVIDAHGDRQLQTALTQLAGGLSQPLHALRSDLLDVLAHLEAGLDFVDEDIQFIHADELIAHVAAARAQVALLAEQMQSRTTASDAVRVVFNGWPNVGKSSLLNALAGDAAAIVSPVAGTTRDYVSRRTVIHGVACELIDTAGVEDAAANLSIAAHAQTMTGEQIRNAELRLLCLDASRPLNDWERDQIYPERRDHQLVVWTKSDLTANDSASLSAIATSSATGAGLDRLRAAIADAIAHETTSSQQVVATTAARCRESLLHAAEFLQQAENAAKHSAGEEIVAAELRAALDELGRVVGAIYTDDILDRVFSRFCIGK